MRFPFRPVVLGLAIGAFLFFIPFGFPFFFFLIFFFFFLRFLFRPWGWRRRYWRHYYSDYHNSILPIDGYGYSPSNSQEPERKIPIR